VTGADRTLSGRGVVVTGAGSGIGRAAALAVAARGARVSLVERDRAALSGTAGELEAAGAVVLAHHVDVSNEDEVRSAFDATDAAWAGIDAVVSAAGITGAQGAGIGDVDLETWNRVIATNLTGTFLVSKHAAAKMIPRGQGVIVLVGSGAGVVRPSGSLAYGASKGGIHGFALSLADGLAADGVRLHLLSPGTVDTPLLRHMIEEGVAHGAPAEYAATLLAGAGDARGVGELIAFLVSDGAAAIRGTISTG
jgi:NAD(P)-dependent dehydrogenase (short-subunit alcohol dehydrogenase family)